MDLILDLVLDENVNINKLNEYNKQFKNNKEKLTEQDIKYLQSFKIEICRNVVLDTDNKFLKERAILKYLTKINEKMVCKKYKNDNRLPYIKHIISTDFVKNLLETKSNRDKINFYDLYFNLNYYIGDEEYGITEKTILDSMKQPHDGGLWIVRTALIIYLNELCMLENKCCQNIFLDIQRNHGMDV